MNDLRYALRRLRRSSAFTITVVVTLALGIGANSAMFGVVDRLMFRPYAYLRDPGSVHRIYMPWFMRGEPRTLRSTEYARYLDMKRGTSSFSQFAGFAYWTAAVGTGDAARERRVASVSASFFDFFDARPALGRFFIAAEDTTPRGADVAVLDYDYWQSELGGRDVVGDVLQVGTIRATIIGIAPRGFVGVDDENPPAIYVPITTWAAAEGDGENARTYFTAYNWGWVQMLARSKPGVSLAQASADASRAHLASWNAQREGEPSLAPPGDARPSAIVSALRIGAGPIPSLEARTGLWVSGVAVIVLLIACANVASLMLTRALRDRRDTGVRLSLGATRARLVRQAIVECLLLSILGAAAGLLVAQWGGAAIRRLLVGPRASLDVLTDWRTLALTAVVTLVVAVITALASALLVDRGDLARTLKSGGREGTYSRSRTRAALLVMQGALSVALLVGATLFVRSLGHVSAMRMGYDADSVLIVRRNLRGLALDSMPRVQQRRALVAAARTIPGVAHASWTSSVPFWSTSSTRLFVPGIDSVRPLGEFNYQMASPDYFHVMGTRILRGRSFLASDVAGAPRVTVVSESMARVLWPGRDALGQCMHVFADTLPCTTVVGVAEDIVQERLEGEKRFNYYLPIEQSRPAEGNWIVLRVSGNPASYVEPVRKALQAQLPDGSYVTVTPLRDVVGPQRRSWRLGATMFGAFGVLALLVAAVGLHGAIAYNVTQRMRELGVRIALGAQSRDVLWLVMEQAVRFSVGGVAAGIAISLVAARWIQPLLFRQSATDPAVFALVTVLLLLVALGASAVPALRATRADPNAILRTE